MLRRCTKAYEARGFSVTVERQNDFRLNRDGATISGRPDLVTSRDDETIIVDVKAAKPNLSHEIQVMLYMAWLPLADSGTARLDSPDRCTTEKMTASTFQPAQWTTASES